MFTTRKARRKKGKLQALRESKFLSRDELAVKSELSTSTINRLEQGKITRPSLRTKKKLAEALEILPDEVDSLL